MNKLKALLAVALFAGALGASQLEETAEELLTATDDEQSAADGESTASSGGCPCTRPACWPYCRSTP